MATSEELAERYGKGFKLMQKMNFRVGQGLGRAETGRKEPIIAVKRRRLCGLGFVGKVRTPKPPEPIVVPQKRSRIENKPMPSAPASLGEFPPCFHDDSDPTSDDAGEPQFVQQYRRRQRMDICHDRTADDNITRGSRPQRHRARSSSSHHDSLQHQTSHSSPLTEEQRTLRKRLERCRIHADALQRRFQARAKVLYPDLAPQVVDLTLTAADEPDSVCSMDEDFRPVEVINLTDDMQQEQAILGTFSIPDGPDPDSGQLRAEARAERRRALRARKKTQSQTQTQTQSQRQRIDVIDLS